jgi:hypothetical protein
MGQLQVSIDGSDRARLRLRGDGRGADFGAFEDAAMTILASSPSRLVVDLDGLSAADTALVVALNGLARHAATSGSGIAVEVPVGALDWLTEAPLEQGVRVERTDAPIQARSEPAPIRATRTAPSPGAPRREGQGFVTSYGDGRPCAEPGCTTKLSRYNNHDRYGVHWLGMSGRR